jgi:hypothetical protein
MPKLNPVLIRNEQEEYKQVKKDLIFVLLLNGFFFLVLLGLFFLNKSTGKIDWFFSKILHF